MSETLAVPAAGQWSLADLERLPDTGSRYEIVDGSLLVSPPPGVGHATDLITKRTEYARGGLPHYWLVDAAEPALTVLRLERGSYRQHAVVRGGEPFVATEPFRLRIVPAQLREPPHGKR